MKSKDKLIKFPEKLIEDVTKYQKENYIASFSGAIRKLIKEGLKRVEEKNK